MFKVVLIAAVVCVANAGLISTGLGIGGVAVAPVAVKTALATSYQNNNQISLHPTAVVAQAPVAVAHAPIAVAHAPVAVAASPIAVGVEGLGGLGLGGLGLGGLGIKAI